MPPVICMTVVGMYIPSTTFRYLSLKHDADFSNLVNVRIMCVTSVNDVVVHVYVHTLENSHLALCHRTGKGKNHMIKGYLLIKS